jgi:exonuclease III
MNKQDNNNVNITLCSFNCRSIKRSIDDIRRICTFADVVALQETWLLPHDLSFLNSISDEFASTGTSAVDTSVGMLRGRPYGGTALLWKKKAFPCTSVISCDNARISAIKLSSGGVDILVFCVYMPNNCIDNLTEFVQCVSAISAIVDENSIETVYILGDYNAHPGELFSNELQSFCTDQGWVYADLIKLGADSDTFTYVSDSHFCSRWLDHCLCSTAGWNSIDDVFVDYGVYCSDHYPLVVKCNLNLVVPKLYSLDLPSKCKQIVWGNRTPLEIEKYTDKCNELL